MTRVRKFLTNIDVVQKSKIKGSADRIVDPLLKDDMATVVTRVEGVKNILGVILRTVIMALNITDFLSRRRTWRGVVGGLRTVRDLWSWRNMLWWYKAPCPSLQT